MKTDKQFFREKQALDVALAQGGADVEFPTHGRAVSFRQRCYTFRKWKRETMGEASPYEDLIIKPVDADSSVVKIRGREMDGIIRPLGGPPIASQEPEKTVPFEDEDDPLLDEVLGFKKKLVGGIDL